jgi:hypothetical protein
VPGDPPAPVGVLVLLGSLGVGLLALLLWSGYRLSRGEPEPQPSPQLRSSPRLDPAAGLLPLPSGFRGSPFSPTPSGATAPPSRGRRDRAPITTGLVLRSPAPGRVAAGRDKGPGRPKPESDRPAESPGGENGRNASVAAPPQRLGGGGGAAALGGSLGLEDLAPAQTRFGASPPSPRAGAGAD